MESGEVDIVEVDEEEFFRALGEAIINSLELDPDDDPETWALTCLGYAMQTECEMTDLADAVEALAEKFEGKKQQRLLALWSEASSRT
ncbi:hypothetical protein CL654_02480 [bacterium]|nr:hypothetical protein [bacterium]|tara:strand:- start:2398 stop:2661 length:264 start_codon:yes stop_codon:yes gene_type:complete